MSELHEQAKAVFLEAVALAARPARGIRGAGLCAGRIVAARGRVAAGAP